MSATVVAPLDNHSSETTLTRAFRSFAKLQRAAYLQDTIEELEEAWAAAWGKTPERLERLERLLEYYRAERRAIARELGL